MNENDSAILRFDDVSLEFGDTTALDHVSFEVQAGETRVLFGEAGSGKTVLLKTAVGLVKPDSGRVFLFGRDIGTLRENELFDVRARAGFLFQEGGLFDSMTILENVGYPLANQPTLAHLTQINGQGEGQGGPRSAARGGKATKKGRARGIEERVREALRFVELEHTLEKVPSELSGGMRRRVGIARAVVTEPELLLYDSPTAGLDPITANTIIALLLKERDLRNTATLMATHRYQDGYLMANFRYNPSSGEIERVTRAGDAPDGNEPGPVSTQFFVMRQGRIVFQGPEAELRASADPYIRKFVPGASQ